MNKEASRKLVAAERKVDILRMRREGHTFEEIGEKLGISRQRAGQVVVEELTKLSSEIEAEARIAAVMESERLDNLTRILYPKATKGNLQAIDRLLKVMERRARLFGLDAPSRIDSRVLSGSLPDGELLALADRYGLSLSPELRSELEGRRDRKEESYSPPPIPTV